MLTIRLSDYRAVGSRVGEYADGPHSSDMSIIQKFLTEQIAVIVMTPYCPTPQHLLHIQDRGNLLSLKTSDESKCPGYLNFLENYSQTHYSEVR